MMDKKYRQRITDDMVQGFYCENSDVFSDSPRLFVILKPSLYDYINEKQYKIKLIKQTWTGREIIAVRGEGVDTPMPSELLHDIFINSVGLYFQFENICDFTNFKIKYG